MDPESFQESFIMHVSLGKNMNNIALKNGNLLSWGKGDHEKPCQDDFKEYSLPFPLIEDRHISFVTCGVSHCMAIEETGRLFGWGNGTSGALGLGDGGRRISCVPITFFETRRAVDVSCGDKFTVVIAEILDGDECKNIN
jgi:alpha-tubulin suppressor-like RCC1 family protein